MSGSTERAIDVQQQAERFILETLDRRGALLPSELLQSIMQADRNRTRWFLFLRGLVNRGLVTRQPLGRDRGMFTITKAGRRSIGWEA